VACGDGHILVTANLLVALKRLRLPTLRRYIWIDALCIDQENVDERTRQVSIMDKIYKAGDKVLIWLGEEGHGTQKALAKLDQIGQVRGAAEDTLRNFLSGLYQRAREARNGYEQVQPWEFDRISKYKEELAAVKKEKSSALQELKVVDMNLFEAENEQLLQGIVGLFSRSYWNRLWIVQEVILSQRGRVICGQFSCDWDHFYKAARQIHDLNLIRDPPLTLRRIITISDRRGYLWHKEQAHYELLIDQILGRDLLEPYIEVPHIEDLRGADRIETASLAFLLEQFSDSQATDPRDRVFALLSLVNTRGPDQLQANYGLTEGQLYHKTMSYVLPQERGFNLLVYFAPPSLSHIPGTPSWVPDFGCPRLWTDELIEPLIGEPFSFRGLPIVDGASLEISGIVYWEIEACTIFISPAEAYHFQAPKPLSTPNIMTFSDLVPPDMSDFMLVANALPTTKYSESQQDFQEWESQSFQERIPQDEVFWDVLNSVNGLAALEMNLMPHEDFPWKFGRPTSFPGLNLVDIYGIKYLHNDVQNREIIDSGLRHKYLEKYLFKYLQPTTNSLLDPQPKEWLRGDMEVPANGVILSRPAAYTWAQQEWSSNMCTNTAGNSSWPGVRSSALGHQGFMASKRGTWWYDWMGKDNFAL
jgi:hypothetical protein